MSDELKACPFCGDNEPHCWWDDLTKGEGYNIECHCDQAQVYSETKKVAIEKMEHQSRTKKSRNREVSIMNKDIIKTGWELLRDNYKGDVDLGTTEYSMARVKGDRFCLIPGTNEVLDWKENFNLTSENGIKQVGVDAMEDIFSNIVFTDETVYFIVHSKSAPTGVSIAKYAKYHCLPYKVIAFNPARSVRRSANIELDNMIMFRNRFDPVSEALGFFSFSHPKCKTYKNWSFRHGIEHWEKFINNMK